jgi:hypothetical protein
MLAVPTNIVVNALLRPLEMATRRGAADRHAGGRQAQAVNAGGRPGTSLNATRGRSFGGLQPLAAIRYL